MASPPSGSVSMTSSHARPSALSSIGGHSAYWTRPSGSSTSSRIGTSKKRPFTRQTIRILASGLLRETTAHHSATPGLQTTGLALTMALLSWFAKRSTTSPSLTLNPPLCVLRSMSVCPNNSPALPSCMFCSRACWAASSSCEFLNHRSTDNSTQPGRSAPWTSAGTASMRNSMCWRRAGSRLAGVMENIFIVMLVARGKRSHPAVLIRLAPMGAAAGVGCHRSSSLVTEGRRWTDAMPCSALAESRLLPASKPSAQLVSSSHVP
mmetsp:Transcript_33229/g.83764  ORF Transcript_33229/g.83764 Transcript_33229/m.83764 type:complete len:265 (-) Transcript_33229:256-1050(-)